MNIVLAFMPFLAFAVLERLLGAPAALLAAAGVSLLLVLRETVVQRKSLKLLETASLILFGLLAMAARLPQFDLSVVAVRLWVDAGLLAIVAASILVGRPFTLQYARERVSPQIAATPLFMKINNVVSALWAVAFAVIVAADVAMLYVPGFTPVAGAVVIIGALAIAAFLTRRLPKAMGRQVMTS